MLPSKFTSAVLTVCFLLAGAAANASVASQTRAYNGCIAFLKLSPTKQVQVARRTPYSLAQTLNACRLLKRNGLAKNIYLDGQYTQWKKDRDAWERANRSEESSSNSGSISDPNRSSDTTTGICYSDFSCGSTGTPVSNRFSCPGSTSSFQAGAGSACERY